MNPAFSIIIFTVLFAFGLCLASLTSIINLVAPQLLSAPIKLVNYVLSFLLIGGSVMASAGHLGQPSRAWRALSQWRSSWLSREALGALLMQLILLVLITIYYFNWPHTIISQCVTKTLELILFPLGLLTLWFTTRIYSSLKTIPAWQSRFTALMFFGHGFWLSSLALFVIFRVNKIDIDAHIAWILFLLPAILAWIKAMHWRDIDVRNVNVKRIDVTGLGKLGEVKAFAAPHTESNFLMREMGYVLARKHSAKLRSLSQIMLFALPMLLLFVAINVDAIATWAAGIALSLALLGNGVERWLFFAEAKHVVMGYYR